LAVPSAVTLIAAVSPATVSITAVSLSAIASVSALTSVAAVASLASVSALATVMAIVTIVPLVASAASGLLRWGALETRAAGLGGREGLGRRNAVQPLIDALSRAAVNVVLLAVVVVLNPDLDPLVEAIHQVSQLLPLVTLHEVRDVGMAVDDQRGLFVAGGLAANFAEDLVADGGGGLYESLASTVGAVLVQHAADGLADALARHLDEAQLGDP